MRQVWTAALVVLLAAAPWTGAAGASGGLGVAIRSLQAAADVGTEENMPFDVSGDGRVGIAEAIHALNAAAGRFAGDHFITDRAGRRWDITHAVRVFDMNPGFFNFGLGLNAIPSVDDPEVIDSGDIRYPGAGETFPVYGVDHNGQRRAYPAADLSRREVFNDVYPGTQNRHVAVTY
jgi:hypothetical protein